MNVQGQMYIQTCQLATKCKSENHNSKL